MSSPLETIGVSLASVFADSILMMASSVKLPSVISTDGEKEYPDPYFIFAIAIARFPTYSNVAEPLTTDPMLCVGGVTPVVPPTVTLYRLLP